MKRTLSLSLPVAMSVALYGCQGAAPDIDSTAEEVVVCPGATTVEGIDVSEYQGNIDWAQVKASGRKFAIIRVSDGTGHPDSTFAKNWAGAKSAGLIRGVYQFFEPGGDAVAQANLLLSKIGDMGALAAGDRNVELAWLNVALDADMQNGAVASELAEVATDLGQLDIALKALRAVTMMKAPGPMTKAQAYLRQGMIAHHQGDARKAAVLARKAQAEDPQLAEAKQFLAQLGER